MYTRPVHIGRQSAHFQSFDALDAFRIAAIRGGFDERGDK